MPKFFLGLRDRFSLIVQAVSKYSDLLFVVEWLLAKLEEQIEDGEALSTVQIIFLINEIVKGKPFRKNQIGNFESVCSRNVGKEAIRIFQIISIRFKRFIVITKSNVLLIVTNVHNKGYQTLQAAHLIRLKCFIVIITFQYYKELI